MSVKRGDLAPFAVEFGQSLVVDDASDDRWREMALETGAQRPGAPARRRAHDRGRNRESASAGATSAGSNTCPARHAHRAAGNGAANAIAAML